MRIDEWHCDPDISYFDVDPLDQGLPILSMGVEAWDMHLT